MTLCPIDHSIIKACLKRVLALLPLTLIVTLVTGCSEEDPAATASDAGSAQEDSAHHSGDMAHQDLHQSDVLGLDSSPADASSDLSFPDGLVVLNEIACHGEDWIELVNIGMESKDISGWLLNDDAETETAFVFPENTIIPAGDRIVVNGAGNALFPELGFGINCGVETIWLFDSEAVLTEAVSVEEVRDDLTYGRLPDGTGDFTETQPTPNEVNLAPIIELVTLNEVSCTGLDWIELYNAGTTPINLEGWSLSDTDNADDGYTITSENLIDFVDGFNPGDFFVVEQTALEPGVIIDNPEEAVGFEFGLDCNGETVSLFNPLGGLVEALTLTPVRADLTLGRLPDGTGPLIDTLSTPLATNEPGTPAEIIINEVNCNNQDWVELVNVGETSVDLGNWVIDDDPDIGGGYNLPVGSVLEPGEHYVIEQALFPSPGFSFGIGCGTDGIWLFNHRGEVIEDVWVEDVLSYLTYGRLPDTTGDWMPTNPTPRDINSEALDSTTFFNPYVVQEIDLTLSDESYNALRSDPYTYQPGQIEIVGSGLGSFEVAIRLKGQWGSFRDIDQKASFKVDLNYYVDGQLIYGLEEFTLNNLQQDTGTGFHEWAIYYLFRAMDVPAPRVSFLWVRLNGVDKGFYANIETIDDVMLDQWYDSTQHLYEGAYGEDISSTGMDMDEGDESDRSDLEQLAALMESTSSSGLYDATQDLIDWDRVTAEFATEQFGGHWDGYVSSWSPNNYYIHFDDNDLMTILPWGTDQAFEWWPSWGAGAYGDVYNDCMSSLTCKNIYFEALGRLGSLVDTQEIQDEMFAIYEIVEPWADMDSTVNLDPHEIADFMEDHRNEVFCEIPLLNTDNDDDGWTTCDGDCNDSIEWAHPGAEEICGDDIDSDCDGSLDADWCECQEFSRLGRDYLICPPTETWEEGRTTCFEEGDDMDLAIINDEAEASWLSNRANNTLVQGYWIGLSDSGDEGVFSWVDGSALDYELWATDEPSDLSGDNDCVQFISGSTDWDDVSCDQLLGVLCEQVD